MNMDPRKSQMVVGKGVQGLGQIENPEVVRKTSQKI